MKKKKNTQHHFKDPDMLTQSFVEMVCYFTHCTHLQIYIYNARTNKQNNKIFKVQH